MEKKFKTFLSSLKSINFGNGDHFCFEDPKHLTYAKKAFETNTCPLDFACNWGAILMLEVSKDPWMKKQFLYPQKMKKQINIFKRKG